MQGISFTAKAKYKKLRVEAQTLDDPIQLGQPIYRLKRAASINLDFEENIGGEGKDGFYSPIGEKPFRLFTRALSSECPKRGCLHELALAEPRVPGTLFYHTDTIMGKVIPPGFLTVEANPRLYCAIVSDDCDYAYSTSPDVEIPGNFTREQMPMCFGTLHDHLYTTNNSVNSEYKNNSQLGYVLTEPVRSKCPEKCLIKLGQMLTNRSEALGIFPMNDHKIVLMGKESADTFYSPTGEIFYCSKKEGQCGANLAIRRYWHLVEMDTIITVNTTLQPPLTIPTWDGVLCYIWSKEGNS
uniref:Uncharacterized protein n=1 Tax=Meloidogyne javanica TaxID=6303 RepID=A0A915N1I3_MELJA